jgi:malate dehydrogenase (oxaloacetate-decarboxylating)(NADP+)
MSDKTLHEAALDYHRAPRPGKIEVVATKSLTNQRDLALAYSPGVAAACEAIAADPGEAHALTARGNLVAVVTNGTAVLGLGAIGPLAAKPVMEGKAVLFKKFAGIDVFDLELAERDPDKLVDIVAALEPTFGGINLEDIKAPECFEIERKLRARMKIPVFHDDQHGTAIVVGAAVTNGLKVVGKEIGRVKLVCSGAGAAALACLDLLLLLGVRRENVWVADIEGVVFEGRTALMDPLKARYAQKTAARTLADIIGGADVFLGLSAGGVLKREMVAKMAPRPLVLALANPTPEIMPEEVAAQRDDAVIATGRSDYPNQVNNVLCFPFIFRGALDVGATTVNDAMKLAAVGAIAALAEAEQSDVVAQAYGEPPPEFGRDYLIPKPFDPRLIGRVAPAVAKAAMESGVATRPIADLAAYAARLDQFVYRSGLVMRPVFARAKQSPKRVAFAEGEDERILRAAQELVDEGIARPVLIGNAETIRRRIEKLHLRLAPGESADLVDLATYADFSEYWRDYYRLMQRRGVNPDFARLECRRRATLIGALMVRRGDADALISGTVGRYAVHLGYVRDVLGLKPGIETPAAMNMVLHPRGTVFICDTYVNLDPTAEQIAEMTLLAAEEVGRFGLVPKVALLSHSNFGTSDAASALKMRAALALIRARAPGLEADGEMHGDAALSGEIRRGIFPDSTLSGRANLLIMPNLDAANIAFNLLKVFGDNITVGPLLLGVGRPAHILTPTATVRRIVNVAAVAVVDAATQAEARA